MIWLLHCCCTLYPTKTNKRTDDMTNNIELEELARRLEQRTVRRLPRDWCKDRLCPDDSCGAEADRPKCFLDMGGYCPRLNPNNYEPSPYITEPDADCVKAAELIRAALSAAEATSAPTPAPVSGERDWATLETAAWHLDQANKPALATLVRDAATALRTPLATQEGK